MEQGFWDADGLGREPDITFTFGSLGKLCDFFAGKTVLPSIRGYNHPALLAKVRPAPPQPEADAAQRPAHRPGQAAASSSS